MAFSVSIMRLVKYVVRGFSILYCRPYFNSSVSFSVNLIFVRFFYPIIEFVLFLIVGCVSGWFSLFSF